jgi:ABC-2 type transport system ATP-binding protein
MLQVSDLSKRYLPPRGLQRPFVRAASRDPVNALDGVSFGVAAGEIVGVVGPNGAGKTTLIKVISTLLDPTRGSASVDGFDVAREPREVRARIGLFLADDRGLYWRLSGRGNLEFFGRLSGMTAEEARGRARVAMSLVGLEDVDTLVFGYSSGMRARLNLARALLSDPPLLVLDEPTRSLDPVITAEVHAFLRMQAERGTAVLLASHRMDEVVSLCDRVLLLHRARMLFEGRPSDVGTSGTPEELASFVVDQASRR